MKKLIAIMVMCVVMGSPVTTYAKASDYSLAKAYATKHAAKVEKVVTIAQGGKIGKVKGTRYRVRYPKKVAKGKKVNVYMVEKRGDVIAMVCLGVIK